jgi:hypothetical protein
MDQDRMEHTLCGMPVAELADFPTTGFRARTIARFQRDMAAWLETSEGRFARWDAERRVDDAPVSGR